MTDDEREEFDREFAQLQVRIKQLKDRPTSTWSAEERADNLNNATRIKRLMQLLIDDSRRAGSSG